MNLNNVFNRAKNLIINPRIEWINIQSEPQTKREILRKYAIPLIAMMSFCSVVGDCLFASRDYFSAGYVISKAIAIFIFTYAGVYLSGAIVNELTTSFNSKRDINLTFKLIIHSFSPFFIISSICLLIPYLGLLIAFSFYSVYVFWAGTTPLLETPEDNKPGFVVVSSLITVGVFAILLQILKVILLGLFGFNQL